jgi:hypothetical protein
MWIIESDQDLEVGNRILQRPVVVGDDDKSELPPYGLKYSLAAGRM